MNKIFILSLILLVFIGNINAQDNEMVRLSDLAKVDFIALKGNDYLNTLPDNIQNLRKRYNGKYFCLYSLSVLLDKEYIYISSEIDKQMFFKFNKKGQFLDSCTLDLSCMEFDLKGKRIYFGMTFLSSVVLNDKLDLVYKHDEREYINSKRQGSRNVFVLGKRRLLSFNSAPTLVISDTKKLFTIKTDNMIFDSIRQNTRLIAIDTKGGNKIVSNGSPITTVLVNKKGNIKKYSIDDYIDGLTYSAITPILDSKRYLLLNTYDVNDELSSRYVYDKKANKRYDLNSKTYISPRKALLNDLCYLDTSNITKRRGVATQFYSKKYLLDNIESLPEKVKKMTEDLSENDSGILMVIRFK